MIKIICRRPGFRRAGIAHPAEATYEPGFFGAEDLAALRADPQFVVLEGEKAVADGADLSDEIQDNGAGKTTPDLGAKSLADTARAEAIVAALRDGFDAGELDTVGDAQIDALEGRLGFRPSVAEIEAAIAVSHRTPAPRIRTAPGVPGTPVNAVAAPVPAPTDRQETEPATAAADAPEGDRIRASLIKHMLQGSFDKKDKTRDGRPTVAVMEKRLGWKPSADEIETAMAASQTSDAE